VYIYVLPCYNETEDELRNTIESINKQIKVSKYHKLLVIICDGKIRSVEVNACDSGTLIGMGLLDGWKLEIEGKAGGDVQITALEL
jgi:hypothetical protein